MGDIKMGVKFVYGCDYCNNYTYVDVAPFEGCDAGEDTPSGWFWQLNDETLKCNKCRGGELG